MKIIEHYNGKTKNQIKNANILANHHEKQIHILNTLMNPRIAYTYYVVPFSNPNIRKLDKLLSKLTKEICNLPKSTANILTRRSHKDFGIKYNFPTNILCPLHRTTTNPSPQQPRTIRHHLPRVNQTCIKCDIRRIPTPNIIIITRMWQSTPSLPPYLCSKENTNIRINSDNNAFPINK